jgi:hypothetical protein
MFGRKTAYHRGYLRALDELKFELFEEAARRVNERDPYTVETLSKDFIGTVNRLRERAIPHVPAG